MNSVAVALRHLYSRCRNSGVNNEPIHLESQLNTGRSAKKCKLHHENEDSSGDLPPNSPIVVPCESIDGSSSTEELSKKNVPTPSRSIIENSGMAKLITDNTICRTCKRVGTLTISFPSLGVTTIPRAHCRICGWTREANTLCTQVYRSSKHKSVVDYDTNMKFCIAFMSNGDGGRDAQSLLSFLSLPNATSIGQSTFSKLERATTDAIRLLTERYT